jgi:hypothetical protein
MSDDPLARAHQEIERLTYELKVMTEEHRLACADRDEARDEITKINDECTKLACRNAILVLQYERASHETVRVKSNIEAAIRRALYEGEG